MSNIVLTSVNAGYSHPNFGLRYILANMGELESSTYIVEGTRRGGLEPMIREIVSYAPAIIGISVAVWNHQDSRELTAELRKLMPDSVIVMGGPEASYLAGDGPGYASPPLFEHADLVLRGEGELLFHELCRKILSEIDKAGRPDQTSLRGRAKELIPETRRIQQLSPRQLEEIRLPYHLLSPHDIVHRRLYIETSRGCPFRCEFCLSSVQGAVRDIPLDEIFSAIRRYWEAGGRFFKFIDRTFNLDISRASAVLDLFLELFNGERRKDAYVQFEVVPDRLPDELRDRLRRFPPGMLRLEVGIQTFNREAAARINRRQDYERSVDNLNFLVTQTHAVIHADLIAGLPGEDMESFGSGFNRLWDILIQPGAGNSAELQLGILKYLPGTTLGRHIEGWELDFSPDPPYALRSSSSISSDDMQRIARAAKYWELVVNRGRYPAEVARLFPAGGRSFETLLALTDYLFDSLGRTWGIDASEMGELLGIFLGDESVRGQNL